jgi:hypothetical protein
LHQGDRFEVLGQGISAQIELQKRGKGYLYENICFFLSQKCIFIYHVAI